MNSANSLKQDFRRALTGSSALYLYGTAMGFLIGILLARGLRVAGYGLYGSAMAAASLGATLASGGIQLHATREISIQRARSDFAASAHLLRWSTLWVCLLAVLAGTLVGAYVLWGQGGGQDLAAAAMAVTILLSLIALAGAVIRGTGAIVLGQALNVAIQPTVQSALLLLTFLLVGSLNPTTALFIAGLAVLLAMPAGHRVLMKVWRAGGSTGQPDKADQRLWTRAATTMGLTTVIRAAEAAAPLIVIGVLSSLEEAGLFRVATSAMLLPSMAGTMLTVMVPAMVSRLYENRETEQLRQLASTSCLAMSVPTLLIALVLWIYGEFLLHLAFGAEYEAAWAAMAILSVSTVVAALGGISIAMLHAARKEGEVTRAFALSIVISVCGSLWLAPQTGAFGVGCAVLAGVLMRTFILAAAAYRATGIDPTIFGTMLSRFRPT